MVKKSVALIVVMISLASMIHTPAIGSDLSGKPTLTETQRKIAIQNGPVRVKVPKFKILRTNPFRKALIAQGIYTDIDDDNIAPSYRRRDLGKIEQHDDAPLPEHIRWRLFLARTAAMIKYKEIHG